jgi:hypothetical protein
MGAVLLAMFGCACMGQAAPVPDAPPAGSKPLRVLLAGQIAMRDAQFLRVFLTREMEKKKADLALYSQPLKGKEARASVVADLPPRNVLKGFPSTFGKLKGDDKAKSNNLASYDVIVAYDLDLERLGKPTLLALNRWVKAGGGLVVVAGPIHTPQLVGPPGKREESRAARDLLPVVLAKAVEEEGDKPRWLKFNVKKDEQFLKLDSKGTGPVAGWAEFFSPGKKKPEPGSERGFYRCQPVKSVKKSAKSLATLVPGTAGKEMPFLVVMPQGKGRVVYIGSAELWRLREYKEEAHERLWLQLLDYSANRKPAR